MPTVVLTYDEVPASSNTNTGVGGRGNPRAIGRNKGRWEGIFAMLLLAERVPRDLARVSITAELQFVRNKTRRDSDNYYFPISKPLGDALVKGGWLPDDTPNHYEFERVRISPEKLETNSPLVKGRMVLTMTYSSDHDEQPPLAQAA